MKISITIDAIDTDVVRRVLTVLDAEQSFIEADYTPVVEEVAPTAPDAAPAPAEKPARKKRSDVGQPRGAYTPRTKNSEPQAGPAGTSAAQTPPAAEAPAARIPAPEGSPKSVDQSELTIEDVRAAMREVANTPGLGMQTNMDLLGNHKVLRVTDLPKESYGEFISAAKALVALKKGAKNG